MKRDELPTDDNGPGKAVVIEKKKAEPHMNHPQIRGILDFSRLTPCALLLIKVFL